MDLIQNIDKKLLSILRETANEMKIEVFIVGGWVRDQILNRPSKDMDFLIIGNGLAFAETLGKKLGNAHVSLFKTYGTAHIKYKDFELEFVGARKESYTEESRNPIIEEGSFEDDLDRRDFTINALALSLNSENFGELIYRFNLY